MLQVDDDHQVSFYYDARNDSRVWIGTWDHITAHWRCRALPTQGSDMRTLHPIEPQDQSVLVRNTQAGTAAGVESNQHLGYQPAV
jgi:hypothetical protein